MKDIELIKQTNFRFYSWRKEFIKVVFEDDMLGKKLRTKLKQSGFILQASKSGDFPFHFWLTRTFFIERMPLNWSTPGRPSGFRLDKYGVHDLPCILHELVLSLRGILPIMSDLYKYYPKYGGIYFDTDLELRYLDFWLETLPCIEEILMFVEGEEGKDLPFLFDIFSSPRDRWSSSEWNYDNLNWRYVLPYGSLDVSDEVILETLNKFIYLMQIEQNSWAIISHKDHDYVRKFFLYFFLNVLSKFHLKGINLLWQTNFES